MNYLMNLVLLSAALAGGAALAAERPNVIVILADDLGYQDVGFTGCTDFKTPNIDRLAREGVECVNGYASHGFCAPTRAGLMTGRYQQRFGFETNPAYAPLDQRSGLPTSETTIATRLQQAGYATGLIGKWHLGFSEVHHPLNRGFDYFFGMPGGGHDYFEVESTKIGEEYKAPLIDNHKFANVEGYLTHQLTDHAIEFIEQRKADPFFLYLSYNAPHAPWQAPQESIDALGHIENKLRRAYAAMIVEMDNDIGRVLKTLEQHGLEQDTLIFFLSDNGGPHAGEVTDNGIFRDGKGSVREGGIHVPFVARWPKRLPAGKQYGYPVISIDIAPTVAALAGAEHGNMEGVNLIPFLAGEEKGAPHENIFFRRRDGAAWAIINKDGPKLLRPDWTSDLKEHYDLSKDPSEQNNLMSSPENAARVLRLQADWDEWNKSNIRYQFWDFPDHKKELQKVYEGQRK
ncbi:sulfatase-like hydrolase/transferase [Pontiella sulfatireligans]|uniref:Arylsulfatase n=1 Tax=Pontiella sulfatireligans TaxID=2750658 RepID=A0A6C2UTB0_9BACT|nr:sulfatase-like hydrolase/transferase [Pontiella sulfatireligans]SPS74519.1 sulfatase S1_19 [Kiritimatiellales bacterium]VGO22474.1 Arylsulfatase [Pontiella sulfatireligans]